jgi:transmembrane sensor
MKAIPPTPSANMIDAAAAAWFAKRDSGAWQQSDQAEFEAWLHSSVAHRVAFIRVEAAWKQAGRLKALGAGVQSGMAPAVGKWQFSAFFEDKTATRSALPMREWGGRSVFLPWTRVAVACVCTAIAVAWCVLSAHPADYRTAVGGMETVPLADGSTVTLNTDSEIQVALSKAVRTIKLKHGEAFFEVAKDPGRPFIVDAGNKRIIAVGTKFSVRRDGDTVQVAVTEGHVRVEAKDAPSEPPAHLAPGDVANADRDNVLVQQEPLAQLETDYLSWREGYVSFRDTPLSEVVREFNRYNAEKIKVVDSDLGAMRIGGNFRATNVEAFLRLVQQAAPIHVVKDGDQIVLERE